MGLLDRADARTARVNAVAEDGTADDRAWAPNRGGSSEAGRDPLFDNARLVLIIFVVTAHVIRLNLYDITWARAIYAWMLIFMMPAFTAIAGHLSSAELSVSKVMVLARRFLAPYLVFELLYAAAHVVARWEGHLIIDLLTPTWVLWFLVALFLWRLSLPLLVKTGHPLLVSVVIGLAGGLLPVPVYALALTRTLVLGPFFVLGYVVSRDRIRAMRAKPVRNCFVLAAAGLTAALLFTGGGEAWLHGTQPYTRMGMPPVLGIPVRLGYYVAVALVVGSFLACIPERRMRLTDLGGRSLYPYLLHGVVLLTLERFVTVPYSVPAGLALLAGGVLMAIALSTRPVMTLARPLVDPVWAVTALARPFQPERR